MKRRSKKSGAPEAFPPTLELWEATPEDSEIRFTLRHLVLMEISGMARRWHALLGIDRARPGQSSIEVVVDAGSIDTGSPERDAQLRSSEFLSVETFPEIRFRSTEVRPDGEGGFVMVGGLTVRDVTREIVLVGEREELGSDSDATLVFTARAMVDRQELRLHWNQDLDRGGVVVGDKVDVQIRLRARPFVKGAKARPRPSLPARK